MGIPGGMDVHRTWGMVSNRGQTDTRKGGGPQTKPQWVQQWLAINDEDIQIHHKVREGGYPNRWGAKQRKLGQAMESGSLPEVWLQEYDDKEVVDWLQIQDGQHGQAAKPASPPPTATKTTKVPRTTQNHLEEVYTLKEQRLWRQSWDPIQENTLLNGSM